MSHLLKYKDFYKKYGLKVYLDENGVPIANGIDCLCDNPKGCGLNCHSGIPCEFFKPNDSFYKIKSKFGEKWKEITEIDLEKDYFILQKSEFELKIEELEERIKILEDLLNVK